MNMVSCKGFMIPGLCFKNGYSIWILKWDSIPAKYNKITEIWVLTPDGRRICYIDPKEGTSFFKKYHSFDEIVSVKTEVMESKKDITIYVSDNKSKIMEINIKKGFSILNGIINFLLKLDKNEKKGERGKTDTGKEYFNHPNFIKKVSGAKVILKGKDLGELVKPKEDIKVGGGRVSKSPLIDY